MFGMPDETVDDVVQEIDRLLDLGLSHLSVYALYDVVAPAGVGISGPAGLLRMALFTLGSFVAALSVLFPGLGKLKESVPEES
jgi:hypothetical protein